MTWLNYEITESGKDKGFIALDADSEAKETTRAQIIASYVAANNLKITQYKDYGWDPVTLPEENR